MPNDLQAQLPLAELLRAISSPTRWQMLAILAAEGPLAVSELADRLGLQPNGASKHVKVLYDAGIIRQSNSRLYRLHQNFPALPGATGMEFGHCQIRFGVPVGKRG